MNFESSNPLLVSALPFSDLIQTMSDAQDSAKKYKDTVLLPNTAFPMKGDLVKREPERLAAWEKSDLYGRIQAKSKGRHSIERRLGSTPPTYRPPDNGSIWLAPSGHRR